MTIPILKISDGTTTIDLLKGNICLNNHVPNLAQIKGGGVYQSSSLAEGRKLVDAEFEWPFETFRFSVLSTSQDETILEIQELLRLLQKAREYWTTDWQNEPVYFIQSAKCETGILYFTIANYQWARLGEMYIAPFLPSVTDLASMTDLVLVIERQHKQSTIPGTGTCARATASQAYDKSGIWYGEFNGADSEIDCGSDPLLDNLWAHANGITIHGWFLANTSGELSGGHLICKDLTIFEWSIRFSSDIKILVQHGTSGTNVFSDFLFLPDSIWHHIAVTYDDGGARQARIWLDGVEVTYVSQSTATGTLDDDSALNLMIGANSGNNRTWDGNIGWIQIEQDILWTANFTPPERCTLPTPTEKTVAQWIGPENFNPVTNQVYNLKKIWYGSFNGSTSVIDCTSNAIVDNMPAGANGFTWDGWVNFSSFTGLAIIVHKWVWRLRTDTLGNLVASIEAVGDASSSTSSPVLQLNTWYHLAMTYDDSGTRKIRLFVNGVEATYSLQVAASGGLSPDSGFNLLIGKRLNPTPAYMDGLMQWQRASSILRWTSNFTPPDRCTLPAIDNDTIGQWIGTENANPIINQANIGTADGTHTAVTFSQCGDTTEGTATNVTWSPCENYLYGLETASCDDPIIYAIFNNISTARIDCGSNYKLDNFLEFTNGVTIEAWIYPITLGGNNEGRICSKNNVAFQLTTSGTLGVSKTSSGVAPVSVSTTAIVLNEWQHVLFSYNNNTDRKFYMWINGTEVTYTTQTAATGTLVDDSTFDFRIGNSSTLADWFDGYIGWIRIKNGTISNDFTPLPRCTLPIITPDIVAQWIGTEDTSPIDNQEGDSNLDGTATDVSFGSCQEGDTCTGTCRNEVYIANKHNQAQITHIFVYDASTATYSPNMATEESFELFPNPAGLGDIIYFGSEDQALQSYPIFSIIFDLMQTASGTYTLIWEYSRGGGLWGTLNVQDNTDDFTNVGVNGVFWGFETPAPSSEGVNTINAIWIRCRISAFTSMITIPTSQNRRLYTVITPYLDIEDNQVLGDIPALLLAQLQNQSDKDGRSGSDPDLWTNRVFCGLRSNSRGLNFTPYLIASDVQNIDGITVTAGTDTVFSNVTTTYTFRHATTSTVGITMEDRVTFTIDETISKEYEGRYHAFVRAVCDDADSTIRIKVTSGSGGLTEIYNTKTFDTTLTPASGDWELIDMGIVLIPASRAFTSLDIGDETKIIIQTQHPSGGGGSFLDLVLMPIDEWAIDTFDNVNSDDSIISTDQRINIDSVQYPKRDIRTLCYNVSTEEVYSNYLPVTNSKAILQANSNQKLWFMFAQTFATGDNPTWIAAHWIVHSGLLEIAPRYLGLKGGR